MSIEQMIQQFLESQANRLSANTRRAYTYDLNTFARSFPDLHVEDITPQHLIAFLNAASDLAPSTLARRQAALRACFRWAYQHDCLPADPTSALESVKVPDRTPSPLSEAQVDAILAAIPLDDTRNRLLFTLLAETGMRIGEALQLHMHEIHLDAEDGDGGSLCICVSGRGAQERTISLIEAPRSTRLLQETLAPNPSGLLFRGDPRKGGRPDDPLDYTTALYHFEQYLSLARSRYPHLFELETQPVTIHRLRHTYAAQKLREGSSLSSVRQMLGHKNMESTMRYVEAARIDLPREGFGDTWRPGKATAPHHTLKSHRVRPTIGVLIGWRLSWTPNPNGYLNPLFRGIRAAATDRECNLLLACGMNPRTELSDPTRPAWPTLASDVDFVPVGAWNTDGLIVMNPLVSQSRSRDIHDLMRSGHPVVFIGEGEGDPAIVADNEGGILQAMRHLIDKHGHRRIAYIAGSMFDSGGDSGARLRAYYTGLQHFGLEIDPNLIAYGYHTTEGGYEAMQQILAASEKFTAVLASNDESAMGAMEALREAGLRIPHDVAIIGFDDRREAAAQVPPLTSVHVPLYKSGYQAVDILLQHIFAEQSAAQSYQIPTSLAIRQSCGCRQDADFASLISTRPDFTTAAEVHRASIVESIAQAVLAETQRFYDIDEIRTLCERLVNGFILSIQKSDPLDFHEMVEELLAQAESADEDAHIWQAVISSLRLGVPVLIEAEQHPAAHQFALDMLDQARNTISERMRRQHGRYIIDQKWMTNRIGHLTTRLLMTSDESQILDVLSSDLPAMGIKRTSLSFFEPDGDDLVGWSTLHAIPTTDASPFRFPTRQFPPQALYPSDQPFALIVVPLVTSAGQVGFIAYDPTDIELAGPITQQIAAALNSARLYLQATEGRKLAEEANNLKSRFLSMVSHELRTPLNLINGLSEMILQAEPGVHEPPLPDRYRQDIEQIHSSAQHLGRLIRDVLDLASSEVGQLRLENELIDLCDTFEMVTATGRQMAAEKGLNWQASLPPDRMWIWGDRTRLRQVALNLVSNAVKFTTRGEVRLHVEVEAGNAIISVCDTGLGISPQDQAVIFDEFRRSDQALARGYGGLGLGLAISKRLVEMHGGEIGVRSSGEEGSGSTFFFTLPLIEPELIHTADQPLPVGADERILLLSDQSGSGDRLYEHLIHSGYEVHQVQIDGSSDWFTPILHELPGAVIFDMGLAPTRSWDILKALKDNPATRLIPLLFYSMTEAQGAMLELDYLAKPVGIADLGRALEAHRFALADDRAEKVFLIVDDDPATLEMHVRIVQSRLGEQHTVMKARNGREALKLMQQKTPHLVLLDLMMPELDGFEVLEAMREGQATRDIPVIVLTGQMLTEKEMARLNRGVATVLGKGLFSVEETLSHIDTALARKRKLGSEAQRLVRRAMAYIHEHYDEPVSREDLSHHLGMSSDYLTLCFRREVGMTFVAYLNRYRINQAKTMLAQNDHTITEIAMGVGFLDSAYFSRVFRRHEGVSPEIFRRTVRTATP